MNQVSLGAGTGPLRGLKVIEIAGIGPAPHACMLLADLGADVIRLERPSGTYAYTDDRRHDLTVRGRPSAAVDLKHPDARDAVLALVERADILIEGMRPGAMERLGLGPDDCFARNPRLVYGRMTGWGQTGPLAETAGHDINFIAVAGVLHGLGQDQDRPHFPSNLLGDFGGGSTYLVIGVLAALLERTVSGLGQVVDAAIVEGSAHLNAMGSSMLADGHLLQGDRAISAVDGGLANYQIYRTRDGEHMAVGALEPPFFTTFLELIGLEPTDVGPTDQPEAKEAIAARLLTRTRDEWSSILAGTDACVAPVLRLSEAPQHEHIRERGVFVEHAGVLQPAPAPRFSRTAPSLSAPPGEPGERTLEALRAWGIDDAQTLVASGHSAARTRASREKESMVVHGVHENDARTAPPE